MADDPTGDAPNGNEGDPAGPDPAGAPANGPEGDGPTGDGAPSNPAPKGDAPKGGDGNDSGSGDGSSGDEDPAVTRANKQAANYRRKLREEEAERQRIANELEQAKQAAGERDTLKETLDGLRKLLDPNAKDDEPADPDELARQFETERNGWQTEREKLQGENRELRVKTVLPELFREAKVDSGLAMAVLQSEGTLAKLDPAADSFTEDAKAAVEQLAESHPRLRVSPQGPRRSGTEPSGSSGGSDQLTYEQYVKLSPDEAVKAQREGRLTKLLGG